MTRKKIKIILFVWPILLLLGVLLHFTYQRYQIDKKLLEADGLVWKAYEKQYTVQVNQHEEEERLHIMIKVFDPEKNEIYKKTEVIDRDMFGGGFARAVQVDQDSESEIVVWHARARYYLDFLEGDVTEVPFDRVPQHVKGLAESWHRYNVMAGVEMTILLIFILSYYVLYVFVRGIVWLFKRKKKTTE